MMYFDPEAGTSTEGDFFTALTLLRSTDIDSAEKLRQMLEESIAKKYGPGRSLATKINGLDTRKDVAIEPLDETRFSKSVEFFSNHTIRTYSKIQYVSDKIDQEIINFIEDDDREDIPTISIPDEGSSAGDGALCKICNGSRIGPLILLECQECQDVYHPLCHQPPVLDLDIYDPRLVWHCAKCVEVSEAAAIVAASGIQDKRHSRVQKSPTIQKKDAESAGQAVRTADDSEDRTNYFRRNKSRVNRSEIRRLRIFRDLRYGVIRYRDRRRPARLPGFNRLSFSSNYRSVPITKYKYRREAIDEATNKYECHNVNLTSLPSPASRDCD